MDVVGAAAAAAAGGGSGGGGGGYQPDLARLEPADLTNLLQLASPRHGYCMLKPNHPR